MNAPGAEPIDIWGCLDLCWVYVDARVVEPAPAFRVRALDPIHAVAPFPAFSVRRFANGANVAVVGRAVALALFFERRQDFAFKHLEDVQRFSRVKACELSKLTVVAVNWELRLGLYGVARADFFVTFGKLED